MATLIKIGNFIEYSPLSRSRNKLAEAVILINNPKITAEYIQADFALYLAAVLKERIRDSINTQKVQGKSMNQLYEPLNKEYALSKPKAYKDKFWINTRHLVDNLTVWRSGQDIRIGFKGRAYYPGTRLRVLQVVLWLEKGTKRIPARPLFTPHSIIIRKNISSYFDRYLKLRFGLKL